MAIRNYNAAESKADLYGKIASDGEYDLLMGDIDRGDIKVTLWQYDANSSATDDYVNGIIKPSALGAGATGRWLRQSNFPVPKRQETYQGVTNSSGIYTVTYGVSYSVEPLVVLTAKGGSNKETQLLTSSATGFSILVELRSDVLGLLPTYAPVNNRTINVLVTER